MYRLITISYFQWNCVRRHWTDTDIEHLIRSKVFKKINEILQDQSFLHCEKDTVKYILQESPRKNNEMNLFHAALRWSISRAYSDHQKSSKIPISSLSVETFPHLPPRIKKSVRVYMSDLILHLRLRDLSVEDFLDVVVHSGILSVATTRQLALDILQNHRHR